MNADLTRRRLVSCCVLAVALSATGCGAGAKTGAASPGSPSTQISAPSQTSSLPSPSVQISTPAPKIAPITGKFEVAKGRSLAIDCEGSGKITVILEVGFDAAGTEGEWTMASLRSALAPRYRVCNYDRANLGQSDPAPKPRTTKRIADDLAALLRAAKVSGPYMPVGVSAGGLYVQAFAQLHRDQVVGVLAMNPESHADLFNRRAFPRFTAQQRADEMAYGKGTSADNTQGIDYTTSARQMTAAGPIPVPLSIIQSTDVQCEGDPICLKTYDIYTDINQDLVEAAAPGGKFTKVVARHDLYLDVLDQVVAEIDRLARTR